MLNSLQHRPNHQLIPLSKCRKLDYSILTTLVRWSIKILEIVNNESFLLLPSRVGFALKGLKHKRNLIKNPPIHLVQI